MTFAALLLTTLISSQISRGEGHTVSQHPKPRKLDQFNKQNETQTHIFSPGKLCLQLRHSKQQDDLKLFPVILESVSGLLSRLGLWYARSICNDCAHRRIMICERETSITSNKHLNALICAHCSVSSHLGSSRWPR